MAPMVSEAQKITRLREAFQKKKAVVTLTAKKKGRVISQKTYKGGKQIADTTEQAQEQQRSSEINTGDRVTVTEPNTFIGTKTFEGRVQNVRGRKTVLGIRPVSKVEQAIREGRSRMSIRPPTPPPRSPVQVVTDRIRSPPILNTLRRGTGQEYTLTPIRAQAPTAPPRDARYERERQEQIRAIEANKSGFERRVNRLEENEKTLMEVRDNILDKIPTPRFTRSGKTYFTYEDTLKRRESDNYLTAAGKGFAALPINIPLGLYSAAGHAIALGEAGVRSVFDKPTRWAFLAETGRALTATPGAVVEEHDPRNPEGLVNLALLGVAVAGVGRARSLQRAKPEVTIEDITTRRSSAPTHIRDITDVKASVKRGPDIFQVEGSGGQLFKKIGPDLFEGKGGLNLRVTGRTKYGKAAAFEAIEFEKTGGGIADIETVTLAKQKPGGIDSITKSLVTAKGKTSRSVTATSTAEVIKNPAQTFFELGATKGPVSSTLAEAKISGGSAGATNEPYLGDLLSGKNVLRLTRKTESGTVASIEQVLSTRRGSASIDDIRGFFRREFPRDLSRVQRSRETFSPELRAEPAPRLERPFSYMKRAIKNRIKKTANRAESLLDIDPIIADEIGGRGRTSGGGGPATSLKGAYVKTEQLPLQDSSTLSAVLKDVFSQPDSISNALRTASKSTPILAQRRRQRPATVTRSRPTLKTERAILSAIKQQSKPLQGFRVDRTQAITSLPVVTQARAIDISSIQGQRATPTMKSLSALRPKTITKAAAPTPPSIPEIGIPRIQTLPGIKIPGGGLAGGSGSGKIKARFNLKRYVPSFTAAAFDIKAKKKFNTDRLFSGFEFRPKL